MNRKYRRRKLNARELPQDAVAAFRRGVEARITYDACSRGAPCQSRTQGEHCATCLVYLDASRELSRLFSLPPWHLHPLDDSLDGEQPDYMKKSGLCAAETWDTAKELRRELQKAAKQ